MQSSNAPNKIALPFAANGTKNAIPVPSQQGVTPGAASFTDGFPPLTFTPLSAGGVPPAGADFNGVLNAITAVQQWQSAGGLFQFDANFANSIGGYPRGAVLLSQTLAAFWICTTDNNTSNPDTGGAGWISFANHGKQIFTSSGSFVPPPGTYGVYLTGCGGGAGGGGGAGATPTPLNGAGGYAGEPTFSHFVPVSPGVSYPITIGAGGAGGAGGAPAEVGQPSGAGGTTSFGSLLSLAGGNSVSGGLSGGPSYGYGTTSTVNVSGGSGYSFFLASGVGEDGAFGLGGGAVATLSSGTGGNGKNGTGYGSGGSGGGTSATAGSNGGAGGNGAPGILIVEW